MARKQVAREAVMNELNVNALNRSGGIDKTTSAAAQKNANARKNSLQVDSAEFSQLPDLSHVEHALESEFATRRANLEGSANSPSYPPEDVIDRLAVMLASRFDNKKSGTLD